MSGPKRRASKLIAKKSNGSTTFSAKSLVSGSTVQIISSLPSEGRLVARGGVLDMRKFSRWLMLVPLAISCEREGNEEDRAMVSEQSLEKQAQQLAQELLILDTHVDLPYRLNTKKMEDVSQRTELGEFDYPRAKAGGLDAVFMSIYVPARYQTTGGAKEAADNLIDLVEGLGKSWPDKFSPAYSPNDVRRNFGRGVISLALGIENGAALEKKLSNLEHFYKRGVRYISLVHGTNNQLGDSSYDSNRKWNGLSPWGRKVVAEMNRLGIMIDVSHLSDESFYDVLELSSAPVIASHSSCRHFTPDWERNMSDEMITVLAEKGGVIQVNFGSMFLTSEYREWNKRVASYVDEKGVKWDSPEATQLIEELREEVPAPEVTVRDVAVHIDHVVRLVGINHVGLGSDYDGVGGELPIGMEDVSGYPNLILELLTRNYSRDDIRKVCSENLLRVWTEVERTASALK